MSDAPAATIKLKSQPFCLDVHPTHSLLAAGLITGQLKVYTWVPDSGHDDSQPVGPAKRLCAKQSWSARPHKEACRAALFSADGSSIFSTGGDCTLQQRDLESNKPIWRRRAVHPAPVNALVRLGNIGLATGDDEGAVQCWDLRAKTAALSFHENSDYVANLLYDERGANKHTLAVAGGDGRLSVFDLRAGRLWARSDEQDDELISLALVKHGKKLLCGMQTGVVGIFSWGSFGDVSDRLLGHPASVDCLLAHGEDAVISGASDGLIRLVGVHPNQVLGVIGEHANEATIEAMALDAKGELLASCAHDQTIRLWDLSYLDGSGESDEDDEEGRAPSSVGVSSCASSAAQHPGKAEDNDDDEDESDEEAGMSRPAKRRAAGLQRGAAEGAAVRKRKVPMPKQVVKKGAAIQMGNDFFAGMS